MSLHLIASASILPSDEMLTSLLPPSLKRRTPLIWQLSYGAAKLALEQTTYFPDAIVCATALGALDETVLFLDKVYSTGFGAPRQFIASVHNSMAGVLAKELGIKGANMTLCDSNISLSSAFLTAEALTEQTILIIAVDEEIDLVQKVFQQCNPAKHALLSSLPSTGAVAFLVSKNQETFPQVAVTPPKPSLVKSTTTNFITPALTLHTAVKEQKPLSLSLSSFTAQATSTLTLVLTDNE